MWLPTPFYDRAPHYWLFIGLLFMIVGVYLGIEMDRYFLFVGMILGLASCAWGVRVFVRRSRRNGVARDAGVQPTAD